MRFFMRKHLKSFSLIAFGLAATASWAAPMTAAKLDSLNERLDSLEAYAGSTVVGKDDNPVAVSGDIAIRFKNFDYYEYSDLQKDDRVRTKVEAAATVGVVVSPASYLTVFTNLYLPFDFSGYFENSKASSPNEGPFNNSERVLYLHSSDYYGLRISENMLAGVDMRTGSFGATLLAGGVIWKSASPLTMWERETMPRFLSQYELFEDEKVVSTYYKEKAFKPVKEGGRAFWTNRSFGGLFLDIHTLPWNMKAQAMLSQPMDMDIGARDGLRMLGSQVGELEMTGTYDFRGQVVHGRLAKEKIKFLDADMTLGGNYMGVIYEKDQIYEPDYQINPVVMDGDGNPAISDYHVASIDIKGNLTPKFYLMMDVALSWDDSTVFKDASEELKEVGSSQKYEKEYTRTGSSSPAVGVYVKAQDKHWIPITMEGVYFAKDFFSPYGMTDPSRFRSWRQDEWYVGAGTFRYGPNMMGANFKLEPDFNRGRAHVQYGIHKQVEKGDDVINYKYNLNGRAMWESTNSWTRHKSLFNSDSGNARGRQLSRIGGGKGQSRLENQEGGVRGGTWELWDGFVPYASLADVKAGNIPQHAKWNSTLALDLGYDIGHWFNTDRNVMLQFYAALSGVSTTFSPLGYSEEQDDMLMVNWYVQSEPAVAITPTLHAVLTLGFETFRAQDAYILRNVSSALTSSSGPYQAPYNTGGTYYEKAPINVLQTAIGLGFDWDFSDRAGLHFRYKWMTNSDETAPENDWKAHYVQAETKIWF